MKGNNFKIDKLKVSFPGLLITLGIVFGSIGTSPLYAMKAIVNSAGEINEVLILGSLSCIFWTITLQTTIKYISIVLKADNKGEGGIFALFALIRKKTPWAAVLTMIGGGALLADGIITPAITVTSSVEGFRLLNPLVPVIPIVIVILFMIFVLQQFGTDFAERGFGPVMLIWFLMLGILGTSQILIAPEVLKALSPVYAARFLSEYPDALLLLGGVFLCIAGAEALYSDLGSCGKRNIRLTWIFVKTVLVLNYFGQGAWLLMNPGSTGPVTPFFSMMPGWFLIPGILISLAASVIATQALIRGSFTLITEAVSLNFWPRIRINHPNTAIGRVYLPVINWSLFFLCSLAVVLFRESVNMEAAYGLAISVTMLITTLLLVYYLYQRGIDYRLAISMLSVFLIIEAVFLTANLHKLMFGGWFTLLLAAVFFLVMFSWYFGRKIKNRRITFSKLDQYIDLFRDLKADVTVPKFATNLVYIIKANNQDQVESKVIYSIFNKQPKRADLYWLLHVDRVDDPNQFEYKVNHIIPGVLIRIDFHIGFKVDPKINLYFREVIEDLVKSGEFKLESNYESLRKYGMAGDFKFVILERIMLPDFKLSNVENFILTIRGIVRHMSIPDEKALQLDSANTVVEKVPVIIHQPVGQRIQPMAKK